MIHDTYGSLIGNDAITLRQRLEKMMIDNLKRKITNWDAVYSAL
jgi:hypothetical protein